MFVEGGRAPVPRHNGTMASSPSLRGLQPNCQPAAAPFSPILSPPPRRLSFAFVRLSVGRITQTVVDEFQSMKFFAGGGNV